MTKQSSDGRQTALKQEQKRTHTLERDNDALNFQIRRLTAERDDLTADRFSMHERIVNLENMLATCKEESNNLMVCDWGQEK